MMGWLLQLKSNCFYYCSMLRFKSVFIDPYQLINFYRESKMEVPLDAKEKHKEEHVDAGELLKSIVYGGLDGSINTLIIILTAIAGGTASSKIVAFCAAAIVGDGIGMGLGDYLSARAEIEYIKAEEGREMYEV